MRQIVIMDEPHSSDWTGNEELFKIIKSLKANAISIIYISHRLEEFFEIGDRITVCVMANGSAQNPFWGRQHELIKMMVNRELKDKFPKQKNEAR